MLKNIIAKSSPPPRLHLSALQGKPGITSIPGSKHSQLPSLDNKSVCQVKMHIKKNSRIANIYIANEHWSLATSEVTAAKTNFNS